MILELHQQSMKLVAIVLHLGIGRGPLRNMLVAAF